MVFRTTSFEAGRRSVLHSGIYNREFSAVLTASAVAGILCTILLLYSGRAMYLYIVYIGVSLALYPVFRKSLFRDRYLEVIFDRASNTADITVPGVVKKIKERIPAADVRGVVIEKRKTAVGNPDGVAFVEKISLQHGTVIPGFGEEDISYLLKLSFADDTERVIYAERDMKKVISAYDDITAFLNKAHVS